ncbi:MAG: acetyl-CoA carboxylase biotin carboxylase subunit [Myxococcota bacterium]
MSSEKASPPFEKVLIANRGEIAVRVTRACRELGIRAAVVYSDVDRNALHVRYADEAYPCGPAPARESYLNIDRILAIARGAEAEAVHPGYGFLSENAEFARRCAEAGLVFIGPRPETIEAMGDKVIARQTMSEAGVPIVPGTIEKLDDAEAIRFAREIGFPVMVKATAGGGGKGMRLVREEAELEQGIKRARSEARASFGDDSIYIEKFVEQPRHIEIQILGDSHGNALHLFERECSIQRRHQKVIEEAPATRMPPSLREEMGQAAVAAAKAVSYEGAGTCEFLVDKNFDFYFLEMNTRVQVEHPVTEMVTNVDIVKTGIRIAAGEKIDLNQQEIGLNGWAIECRIYAEDPEHAFRPSPGEILVYRPPGGPGVRNDSGVYPGAEVTVYYDPLISKLICWGRDRTEAIARMRRALKEFVVKGIKTSIPFHRVVMEHPLFVEGRFDTSFIETEILRTGTTSLPPDGEERRVAIMLAAIAGYKRDRDRAAARSRASAGGAGTLSAWKQRGRLRQLRRGL